MKILVTGGAGYIGSHVCKALSNSGFCPVVYDNLSRGTADAVKWGDLETGDLNDGERLRAVLARHRPGAVMHFAALAYAEESMTDPNLYYWNNVVGTISLLEAMLRQDVKTIIFSSTCATYGSPGRLPLAETDPQTPISPYGRTKLMVEHLLGDYASAYGVRFVILRYFNAAGADPDGEIGEDHDPETHAIPSVILAALGQRAVFRVFGVDFPTRDGSAIRDYIHVTDLAAAHVAALKYLLDGNANNQFNLGSGCGTSVRELLSTVERLTGRMVPVEYGPRRPGDAPILVAHAAKANELLRWRPAHSGMDTIVTTAARWFARRPKRVVHRANSKGPFDLHASILRQRQSEKSLST
jgi:UDP-arabinose 4-epimerase